MKQDIRMAAILERDGRLFLVRPRPDAPWELPGGPLPLDNDDIDAEMDAVLQRMGVMAPAIEEDFLQTHYFPFEGGQVVYNVYAATDWAGDPSVAPGHGAGWFGLDDIPAIHMDEHARNAILEAFGLKEREDDTAKILEALGGGAAPTAAPGQMGAASPGGAESIFGPAAGDVWSNPTLERKTRSLQVVAMLAAMGRTGATLASHIDGALNHGATPEEVIETLRTVAVYAGLAVGIEAWPVMEQVFEQRGISRPRRPA